MDALVTVSLWMIIPVIVLGTLLHFLYDWSKHHRLAAIVSAVNESYWEHIKIAVWPVALLHMVLYAIGGYQYPAFIPASTLALYSLPISMVGLVFLYKSVTKRNVLWLDIAAFGLIIVLAQVIFIEVLQQLDPSRVFVGLSWAYLLGLLAAFLTFTLRPPSEPDVFIDPITKGYGTEGHPDL